MIFHRSVIILFLGCSSILPCYGEKNAQHTKSPPENSSSLSSSPRNGRNFRIGSEQRLETYTLLLQAYDNQRDNAKAISLLEKLLNELESGEMLSSEEEKLPWIEKLAQRYTWATRTRDALQVMEGVSFDKMTATMKAINVLALDEQGMNDEALSLSSGISPAERKTLDPIMRHRLSELGRQPASPSLDGSVAHNSQVLAEPPVASLLESTKSIQVTNHYIQSGSNGVGSVDLLLTVSPQVLGWGILSQVSVRRAFASPVNVSQVRFGGQYRSDRARYRMLLGYLGGGRYRSADALIDYSGMPGLVDFSVIAFELNGPLTETTSLFDVGASESRFSSYWEKRFSSWIQCYGDIVLRSTHTALGWNEGQGFEASARLGIGKESSSVRIGPWVYWMRWGSDAEWLRALLSPRNSIIGIFGSLDWGGAEKGAFRGRIIGGLGDELTDGNSTLASGFLEATIEKWLSTDSGIKGEYSLYTSRIIQTLAGATHIARIQLFKKL